MYIHYASGVDASTCMDDKLLYHVVKGVMQVIQSLPCYAYNTMHAKNAIKEWEMIDHDCCEDTCTL